jgi:hypothetical protein
MSRRDEEAREIIRDLDALIEKARASVDALAAVLAGPEPEMELEGDGPGEP